MFNEEEDWSDDQEGKILSKSVFKPTPKAESSTHFKSDVIGKKSLLRTLETLGSAPDWKSSEHEEQDSESETEVTSSPSKKRKKRRKKRKHGAQEGGDQSQAAQEERSTLKKKKSENKPGASKTQRISAKETKGEKVPEPPQENANKQQGNEKLSRKQWKNKIKNKKRCKNKFRQSKPEEDANRAKTTDKQEPAEEIKIDPHKSNSENISQTANQKQKKGKERKPVKRKKPEQEADGLTTAVEKKQLKLEKLKGANSAKSASKGSTEGFKHKEDELKVEISHNLQKFPPQKQKKELSKEQILKREKLQKILISQEKENDQVGAKDAGTAAVREEVTQDRSDSLRSRMEQRLEAARFRYINELLYSKSSGEARRMFQQDPQAFWVYHKGYTAQVQRWPANPVNAIISYIQKKPPNLVVADFGCGDCKIARSVKNKVHSFDLAATCELVTVCDMAKVPLDDSSVDIAVFCLSLMGTNLAEFLAEANRVLKMRGILKIAEVASRFDNVDSFISGLTGLGFKMTSKDTENSHFFSFEFVKTRNAPNNVKKFGLELKPCVYKKR
ncbi:PREDICTED: ribosomal RNA-processing protein 8 [Cyprinodon variegatus]|uniref:Ribosomal RNA-processing protein 8 n=1 Tax=Cyprinodon variegatus TaxID=28743 RepID=A0A3Q2E2M6_CYPVA|nr:PREDICTED: ribosomal RNA-processing protein 8 [Cyprinodon variegatus]